MVVLATATATSDGASFLFHVRPWNGSFSVRWWGANVELLSGRRMNHYGERQRERERGRQPTACPHRFLLWSHRIHKLWLASAKSEQVALNPALMRESIYFFAPDRTNQDLISRMQAKLDSQGAFQPLNECVWIDGSDLMKWPFRAPDQWHLKTLGVGCAGQRAFFSPGRQEKKQPLWRRCFQVKELEQTIQLNLTFDSIHWAMNVLWCFFFFSFTLFLFQSKPHQKKKNINGCQKIMIILATVCRELVIHTLAWIQYKSNIFFCSFSVLLRHCFLTIICYISRHVIKSPEMTAFQPLWRW